MANACSVPVVPLLSYSGANDHVPSTPIAQPHTSTPPTRGRQIADLINSTDSSPSTSSKVPLPVSRHTEETLVESPKVQAQCGATSLPEHHRSLSNDQPSSEEQGETRSRSLLPSNADMESPKTLQQPTVDSTVTSPSKRAGESGSKSPSDLASPKASNHADSNTLSLDSRSEHFSSERKDGKDDTESEETRCPCRKNINSGTMIACDGCNTWQHIKCMGFRRRLEAPEEYYCHICRPEEMRPTCIAHPQYRERNGKDRDAKESRREFNSLLSSVKPLELRKIFSGDLKQKKSVLKAGKDYIVQKYANILKTSFPKYRSAIVDGLTILLDVPRTDVVEKLDFAIRKMRQHSSERSDEGTDKTKYENSLHDMSLPDLSARAHVSHRTGVKRHRQNSLSDQLDTGGISKSDLTSQTELPEDTELGKYSNTRGLTREERKLQAEMRLFKRIEEREREKKRLRTGEFSYSPRAGNLPRPKTPRSNSTPRPLSPSPPTSNGREGDDTKARDANVRKSHSIEDDLSEDIDSDGSPTTKAYDQNEQIDSTDKLSQVEDGKNLHRSVPQTWKSESDSTRDCTKRERQKSDRQITKRREPVESSHVHWFPKQKSILQRNRSVDSKRRRAISKDARCATKETKRDPALDLVVHVVGPSVLGSKLIPKSRVSALLRDEIADSDNPSLQNRETRHSHLLKKNTEIRSEYLPWEEKLAGACPAKKRHCMLKEHDNSNDCNNLNEVADKAQGVSPIGVSMVVVSEKKQLPYKGEKLEAQFSISTEKEQKSNHGNWKTFSFKKRILSMSSKAQRKEVMTDKDVWKISPVSPNHSLSPVAGTDSAAQKAVPTAKHISLSVSSPKLRSSPLSSPRRTMLRSFPIVAMKRARSPSHDCRPLSKPHDRISDLRRKGLVNDANHSTATDRHLNSTENLSPRNVPGVSNEHPSTMKLPAVKAKSPSSGPLETVIEAAISGPKSNSADVESLKHSRDSPKFDDTKLKAMNKSGEVISDSKKPKLSHDGVKRAFSIPLSKPVPSWTGSLSEGNTPNFKKNGLGTGLGLRSIRSAPIPEISKKPLQTTAEASAHAPQTNTEYGHERNEVCSPLDRKQNSDVCTVSDILQQRLEGFLKPTNSPDGRNGSADANFKFGAGKCGSSVMSRSHNGQSEKQRHYTFKNSSPVNGLGRNAVVPTDVRSNVTENLEPWAGNVLPSFANSKRPHIPFHAGRLGSSKVFSAAMKNSGLPSAGVAPEQGAQNVSVFEDEKLLGACSSFHPKQWSSHGYRGAYGGPSSSSGGSNANSSNGKIGKHGNHTTLNNTNRGARKRRHE